MDIQAIVLSKGKIRRGRGFSRKELKEAGLRSRQALKLSIPVDARRRSKREKTWKL